MSQLYIPIISAVVSWLIAHFYYNRQKNVKSILFTTEYFSLLTKHSDAFGDLIITQNGVKLNNPEKFYFYFWNNGSSVISKSDFARNSPLTIKFSNCKLRNISILKSTKPSNSVKLINTNTKRAVFSFDYLDPQDGFVVETILDKNSDFQAQGDISVLGDIKGNLSKIKKVTLTTYKGHKLLYLIPVFLILASIRSSYDVLLSDDIKITIIEYLKFIPLSWIFLEESIVTNLLTIAFGLLLVAVLLLSFILSIYFIYTTRKELLPTKLERN